MANDGSYLESKLQTALAKYARFNKALKHRFYDTKSAGGSFLPAQPGDFFLLVPGSCILIECKSTEADAKLIRMAHHGKQQKNQIAKHKLWTRAGHPAVYLHLNIKTKVIEWHDSNKVIIKKNEPIWVGGLAELADSIPDVISLLQGNT